MMEPRAPRAPDGAGLGGPCAGRPPAGAALPGVAHASAAAPASHHARSLASGAAAAFPPPPQPGGTGRSGAGSAGAPCGAAHSDVALAPAAASNPSVSSFGCASVSVKGSPPAPAAGDVAAVAELPCPPPRPPQCLFSHRRAEAARAHTLANEGVTEDWNYVPETSRRRIVPVGLTAADALGPASGAAGAGGRLASPGARQGAPARPGACPGGTSAPGAAPAQVPAANVDPPGGASEGGMTSAGQPGHGTGRGTSPGGAPQGPHPSAPGVSPSARTGMSADPVVLPGPADAGPTRPAGAPLAEEHDSLAAAAPRGSLASPCGAAAAVEVR